VLELDPRENALLRYVFWLLISSLLKLPVESSTPGPITGRCLKIRKSFKLKSIKNSTKKKKKRKLRNEVTGILKVEKKNNMGQ